MESSVGAAFDGTNFLVGIGDKPVPDANNTNQAITAQLVSKAGVLVGPRIVTTAIGGSPSVAFDGTNYLLVYEEITTDTVAGQFINTAGGLVGSPFNIFTSPNRKFGVPQGVLFDGANYFVVWESDSVAGNGDSADVYGQFITPNGTKLGAVVSISTGVHGQRSPSIAFDGTNILAIWADGRNQSACYTDGSGKHCYESDVYGQLIAKSSASLAGTLSGSNFLISTGTLPRDGSPLGIAYDGTNFLITFTEETTFPNACPSTGCNWEAYALLVSKAGISSGSKFVLGNSTTIAKVFAIPAYVGNQYLVTWTDGIGTASSNVKGQYVTTTGAVSGAEFTLYSSAPSGALPWLGLVFSGGGATLAVSDWGIPDPIAPGNIDLYSGADVLGSILDATTISFLSGWNLVGNSNAADLNVAAIFGDVSKVTTVWKWVPGTSRWAFYAPSMNSTTLAAYAASKGYDVLSTVSGGEGFWVNAVSAFSATLPAGTPVASSSFASTLGSSWSLISIGDSKTPRAFNNALSLTPPSPPSVAATVLTTLWAWNSSQSAWYFYAPALDNSNGLAAYATSKGYLDFGASTLTPAMGFWVNKP
jgi:hypothetical protein